MGGKDDLGSCSPTEGSTLQETEEATGADSSHRVESMAEKVLLTTFFSLRDLNSSDLMGVGHVLRLNHAWYHDFGDSL